MLEYLWILFIIMLIGLIIVFVDLSKHCCKSCVHYLKKYEGPLGYRGCKWTRYTRKTNKFNGEVKETEKLGYLSDNRNGFCRHYKCKEEKNGRS